MKKLIFLFLILICFIYAPTIFAQHSYSEFEKSLELTEPQKAQVQGIRNRYMNEWQTVRKESTRKRLELKELGKNPAANPEKMGRLENERRELDAAKGNIYNRYRAEVSRVLNEKQRERYNNFFNTENKKMMHPSNPARYGR
jgi:Spy/CpxP family protein refolding chaperone